MTTGATSGSSLVMSVTMTNSSPPSRRDGVQQQDSVGQPGQGVVQAAPFEVELQGVLGGGVAGDDQDGVHLAGGIVEGLQRRDGA